MSSADERRKARSERLADSIKETERRRELRKFQEEWNERISIARQGRLAYEKHDPSTAMLAYKKFMSLTARRYEVAVDDLHPRLFSEHDRVSECLLISGICFDLIKILDQMNGETARRELTLNLSLYVKFSRGMPFQPFSFTSLEKYIKYSKKVNHPREFAAAAKSLQQSGCFVATAVFGGADEMEVAMLRYFRDSVLAESRAGRAAIAFYGIVGPLLAQVVSAFPSTKKVLRPLLAALALKLWQRHKPRSN